MAKIPSSLSFAVLTLDHQANAPLFRQLYQALRQAILAGRMASGTRLPSSRELAADLGVSRNTVVNARPFHNLLAMFAGYPQPLTKHDLKLALRICSVRA